MHLQSPLQTSDNYEYSGVGKSRPHPPIIGNKPRHFVEPRPTYLNAEYMRSAELINTTSTTEQSLADENYDLKAFILECNAIYRAGRNKKWLSSIALKFTSGFSRQLDYIRLYRALGRLEKHQSTVSVEQDRISSRGRDPPVAITSTVTGMVMQNLI